MNASIISWYLCGLFIFTSLTMSVVTVIPQHESAHLAIVIGCLVLAIVFGVMAVGIKRLGTKGAKGKWATRSLLVVAFVATIMTMLLVGG